MRAFLGIIVGIVTALLGYVTQLYFNRRRDRRELLEHSARMERLLGEWDGPQG